jgi:hypothetical protein
MAHKRHPTFEEWTRAVYEAANENPPPVWLRSKKPISIISVFGHCRAKSIIRVRWQAWKKLRDDGFHVYGISKASGFDHTTILHAMSKMDGIAAE